MKRIVVSLLFWLPFVCTGAEYQSSLLVQTGKLRESDLIVRTITDLESNKICLVFYVRTQGTSSIMTCYDARPGFRSTISQVGFFKDGELVVRKVKDFDNNRSCLVAYVSTPGTSPAIDCYQSTKGTDQALVPSGDLREGDLDIHRMVDPESTKTCLVTYVIAGGTSPSLLCYNSIAKPGEGGLIQTGQLREGDLVVRKVVDQPNHKTCLVTYVSTKGTSPYLHCFDEHPVAPPRQ